MKPFNEALDALINEYLAADCDVDEMIADLQGQAMGLIEGKEEGEI